MDNDRKTPTVVSFGYDVLDRMVIAVERVRDRLHRATAALEAAAIPYAVIGGNAVAAWVSRIDRGAIRNTADVDLLIDRRDFDRIKTVMESAGFTYCKTAGVDMFLDGPDSTPRDAVHILFTNEKTWPNDIAPAPDLSATDQFESFRILAFDPLVRMKLTSFRLKDRVHLLDMIEVGLLDRTWLDRLPRELATRLKELLDNPQG